MLNKEIFKLLGNRKKYLWLMLLLMVGGLFCSITFTYFIAYTLDYLINNNDKFNLFIPAQPIGASFLHVLAILFSTLTLKFISGILINNCKKKLSAYIKINLRNNLYTKMGSLGLDVLNEISIASLQQSAIEGIEQLDLYYTIFLPQFFYSLLAPFLVFSACVGINYLVALVLLGCVPLIPVTIMLFARKAKHIVNKYLDKYHHLGDTFLDGVYGLNDLKYNLADTRYYERLKNSSSDFRKTTMKVLSIQLISLSLMDLIAFGASGLGIVLALVKNQGSYLYPLLFLVLISAEFFLPLRMLGSAFHISLNGVNAGKKLLTILNLKEKKWGQKQISSYQYNLEKVVFSYDKKKPLLNINKVIIPVNQITAFAGNSGSGKSTIIKLLLGQIVPQEGMVLVDNNPLFTLAKEKYYQHIGIINNDSYLFNETIRNNFLLFNPALSDDKICYYLQLVKLEKLLDNEEGLNYLIDDMRSNLSGGERQRLVLAIMLSQAKSLYIFDEATSNIDLESEAIILDIIKALKQTATVVLISHRLSNLASADNIYYLADTRIVEEGNHATLLKQKGLYYELYNHQQALINSYKNNI